MTSQQLARQLGVGRVCCRPEFDLVGPSSVTYARTTVTIARSSHDAGACSELGHSRMRRGQSRQRQGARRNSSERSSSSGRAAACGPTTGGCHRNRPGTVEKLERSENFTLKRLIRSGRGHSARGRGWALYRPSSQQLVRQLGVVLVCFHKKRNGRGVQ